MNGKDQQRDARPFHVRIHHFRVRWWPTCSRIAPTSHCMCGICAPLALAVGACAKHVPRRNGEGQAHRLLVFVNCKQGTHELHWARTLDAHARRLMAGLGVCGHSLSSDSSLRCVEELPRCFGKAEKYRVRRTHIRVALWSCVQ